MSRVLSGSPVPRHQVFVLDDGEPVVQWSENYVQEIHSGRVREFDFGQFGHRVNDHELEQLKSLGLIEHFNRQYIWVYALPEQSRYMGLRTIEGNSKQARVYYLNTTLPESELNDVVELLEQNGAGEMFTATAYDGVIAIIGYDWEAYISVAEAETAQRTLVEISPVFESTAVAFVEMPSIQGTVDEDEPLDLDALIASQSASPVTEGKQVIVICRDEMERQQIESALTEMKINVRTTDSGVEALQFLEECAATEYLPHLLILDIHLEDMHGWEVLSRMREIHALDALPVIALADDTEDPTLALTVAGVYFYLTRPLNIALLRQSVYETLLHS
jgi:CheY-like chemotaxis protein